MIFIIGGRCSGKTAFAESLEHNKDLIFDQVEEKVKEILQESGAVYETANEMTKEIENTAEKSAENTLENTTEKNAENTLENTAEKNGENTAEKTADQIIAEIAAKPESTVVIGLEMGDGIVPMDTFDRKYREVNGRVNCRLAQMADEVYLMECGIPVKIK